MIYTYDDFEKEAQSSGLYNQFSTADINLAKANPDAGMSLLNYKKEYAAATTADQRALINANAEAVRKKSGGYTAGSTGSGFTVSTESPSTYQATEYTNPYAAQINAASAKAQSSNFSFNPETDAAAQSYKKMYTREGERATRNTLAQTAAMTGGIPSTYATTAAAQAGQYYASQLADKTTELEENAYNRYMQEKNIDLAILDALSGLDSQEYSKYATDRSFDYEQAKDNLSYQTTQKATTDAALEERAKTLAASGDYSLLPLLGYSDAEIASIKAANDKKSNSGYSGTLDSGDGNGGTQNENQGITLTVAANNINSFLNQGASIEQISQQLDAQHSEGTVSDDEYSKYKIIIDAKTADAKRANAK